MNFDYFLVTENFRGLTKQRNYGYYKVTVTIEVVAFLDDDTVLRANYF